MTESDPCEFFLYYLYANLRHRHQDSTQAQGRVVVPGACLHCDDRPVADGRGEFAEQAEQWSRNGNGEQLPDGAIAEHPATEQYDGCDGCCA